MYFFYRCTDNFLLIKKNMKTVNEDMSTLRPSFEILCDASEVNSSKKKEDKYKLNMKVEI